jgi:hypothetical protein
MIRHHRRPSVMPSLGVIIHLLQLPAGWNLTRPNNFTCKGLGVDVGAGPWDWRSQRCTCVCARSVGGAGRRSQARTMSRVGANRCGFKSVWHSLTKFFSNFCNRSDPRWLYKSCRALNPLQLLERLYRFFLNQFCRMACQLGRFLDADE